MASDLTGKRVLITVTNYGVEQDELVKPLQGLKDRGADVTVAAVEDAPIETLVDDKDPGDTVQPDATLDAVDAADFDILVVPGGSVNADAIRTVDAAVDLVGAFTAAGKPVAAICHAPWLLIEADVVRGREVTSFPSLKTDLRNAGADWADEQVRIDEGDFTLITSRNPDDLDAFVDAISERLQRA